MALASFSVPLFLRGQCLTSLFCSATRSKVFKMPLVAPQAILRVNSYVVIWYIVLFRQEYTYRPIAMAADCDPFEVSVPLLVGPLPRLGSPSTLQLEQLVHSGRQLGRLAREPTSRAECARVELSCYQPAPPDLPRQRPVRAPGGPRAPKPTASASGRPGCSGRGAKRPNRPRRSEPPKPEPPGPLSAQFLKR
jgi:hypothetical protein